MPYGIDKGQHHIEAVLYDDHAIPRLRERTQRSHQHCRAVFIEIGEWFIKNNYFLPHCKRACRDEPLFLPARKGAALPTFIEF